ncbi:hypothetical protein IEN85_10825 [Pelagicoccus sp. NFK12]|uniref:Uncharacterized protein n=1 Tax=Pelagicoccus enzymogenes TaxID=2773457 RepID=A0A927IFD6_9BACT|nr:DUF6508 domain-containing protein [Pelagicoccus enzymogenes]MBD5779982.1 hypothetical protein [Pelagicoccus enzymogenes]
MMMGFFSSSPEKEIKKMIDALEPVAELSDDAIATWKGGIPIYDKSISKVFERKLSDFWIDQNYLENKKIIGEKKIEEFELDELKTAITAFWRMERFSYGAWASSIQEGFITKFRNRLIELKN